MGCILTHVYGPSTMQTRATLDLKSHMEHIQTLIEAKQKCRAETMARLRSSRDRGAQTHIASLLVGIDRELAALRASYTKEARLYSNAFLENHLAETNRLITLAFRALKSPEVVQDDLSETLLSVSSDLDVREDGLDSMHEEGEALHVRDMDTEIKRFLSEDLVLNLPDSPSDPLPPLCRPSHTPVPLRQ